MGRTLKSIVLGSACAIALVTVALAQASTVDVPAGDLRAAIDRYAQQSGVQVIYNPDDLSGFKSAGVHGNLTPDQVIHQLLVGTGLVIKREPSGATGIGKGGQPKNVQAASGNEAANTEQVVVTGSRLASNLPGSVKVDSYSSTVVKESGKTSVVSFLNSLPSASLVSNSNGKTQFGSQQTVRLHGLPIGTTLVLIDGQRVGVSGLSAGNYFDLNAIPTALVDRIEIVPVGSSAVYGSDAIGGVVNLILKKDLEGVGFNIDESIANGYQDARYSAYAGTHFEHGYATLGISYEDGRGLYARDRALTADPNFTRFSTLGGVDQRSKYCLPGTVQAATGTLAGLTSNIAGIPSSGADVVTNYIAGQSNLCSLFGQSRILVAPSEKIAGFLSGEYELRDGLSFYTENMISLVSTDNRSQYSIFSGQAVPATNPYNPFHQAVLVTTALPVPLGGYSNTIIYRPMAGLRGNLFADWTWDVSGWGNFIHDDYSSANQFFSPTGLAALASSDPTTALNIFAPQTVKSSVWNAALSKPVSRARTQQYGTTGVVRGTLLELPAGPVAFAAGAEFRREALRSDALPTVLAYQTETPIPFAGTRDVSAGFAEARIPLLGSLWNDTLPLLQLDLAARYDGYSDFGGRLDPQYGATVNILRGMSVSATYSTSFKAPSQYNVYGLRNVNTSASVFDPKLGITMPSGSYTQYSGGNPNLLPEKGNSLSVELKWAPEFLPDFYADVNYWKIGEKDRIVTPSPTAILANESIFSDRVTRDASGRITILDVSYINFPGLHEEGLDLNAHYNIETDWGVLVPSVVAERILSFTSQVAIGTPFVNRVSAATASDVWAPRYKAALALNWNRGPWDATFTSHYLSEYSDYQTPVNTNRLGGYWTADVGVQYDLGGMLSFSGVTDTQLGLSVSNLFDKSLDFSNFDSGGVDAFQADYIGRMVTLSLSAKL